MDIFLHVSAIIAIAAAVALIMQSLKQPLILGHILTGFLVGPIGLNLVQPEEGIEVFSHLGITSLLFIVGLGLSPRVMREVGRVALIAGIGQVVFTTILGYALGIAFGLSQVVSIYLAVACTFSSTIIVSKILSDKRDANKLYGKIAIGMLLVQDILATVALILITSSMAGGSVTDIITSTVLKGVIVAGLLYLASVYLLPALTRTFAKSQEFLFLFSVGWGMGIAALFHVFGLSVELGALAAGVALAASPYHYEISAKMKLLRDFFVVLFFVLLGSQLTIQDIGGSLWIILAFSAFILIGNPLIVMIIMGIMRYSGQTSFRTGLTVAQISEFSLILIMLGISAGHIPANVLSIATIIGVITIAGSTVLMLNDDALAKKLAPLLKLFERKRAIADRERKQSYRAILFGCHRVGSDFLPSIMSQEKSYLVVDFDPQVIAALEQRGIHARYGDAQDDAFIDDTLNLEHCKLIVSTIPDFETNAYLLARIRKVNKHAVVIVIAQHIYEAKTLYADGASYVVMPHHMGGNYAAMLVEKHGGNAKPFAREKIKHLKHLEERHAFMQQSK
ncbi:MAG: cation:proton antiporter [Candidatus Uhrbacteria bacterium]|nr:cation:proton antiporter [Candidatus Uhrbacteria bacterium]